MYASTTRVQVQLPSTHLWLVALTSSNVHAQVSTLESCLSSLQVWFCANSIILNPDKSNSVLFATTQRVQLLPNQVSINISGVSIPLSNHVKILDAVLDPHITLSDHTKAVLKSSFYHNRALRHIRGSLDHLTIRTIAAALVSTKIMQILFCTAFLLNIFLVSSTLKLPLHALLQANDILVPPF